VTLAGSNKKHLFDSANLRQKNRVYRQGTPMRRRTTLFYVVTFLLVTAVFLGSANAQQGLVTVRIRADESARAIIPPLAQQNLRIERDLSQAAKDLVQRAPPGRATPIVFDIVGPVDLTTLFQMIRELLRQTYYGGVLIDTRSQPPSVTSDPKLPPNLISVIDDSGRPYQLVTFSMDTLRMVFKVR
jgi:hypothetical protein